MKFNKKIFTLSIITITVFFTGCLDSIADTASNFGTIMETGKETFNMFQSVEIDGAKNKSFTEKDFHNIKSVAIKFSSSETGWAQRSNAFADAVETELMKIGLNTYKYSNDNNGVSKATPIRKLAIKLRKEGIQALITGTVKASIKDNVTFGSIESKALITGVSFSIVSTKNGKTMASINLSYKKGVSAIEAAKDIAKALKALIKYPNMDIKQAFKKVSK